MRRRERSEPSFSTSEIVGKKIIRRETSEQARSDLDTNANIFKKREKSKYFE